MKKVMTIIALRPDIIRLAATIKRLDADPEIEHIIVHTGQSFDANRADIFYDEFKIRHPDYNLKSGAIGKPHYKQLADLTVSLYELCDKLRPDAIIYLGDSTSSLTAPVLKKLPYNPKIIHIEAGMRVVPKTISNTLPEETNRIACDHASDHLFAYSQTNYANLMAEGINKSQITVCGNTIVEPLKMMNRAKYESKNHILLDVHRYENTADSARLQHILRLADSLSQVFKLPVKMLNYFSTTGAIKTAGLNTYSIETIPLVGYQAYINLQQQGLFLISDSGSSQEEGPLLGVPVLVPRTGTERPESVENNCSFMVDIPHKDYSYLTDICKWLNNYWKTGSSIEWLGTGNTSEIIYNKIKEILG